MAVWRGGRGGACPGAGPVLGAGSVPGRGCSHGAGRPPPHAGTPRCPSRPPGAPAPPREEEPTEVSGLPLPWDPEMLPRGGGGVRMCPRRCRCRDVPGGTEGIRGSRRVWGSLALVNFRFSGV